MKIEKIKRIINEARPLSFKPCPYCGRKVELGSIIDGKMKFGCYHQTCPAGVNYQYFYCYRRKGDVELNLTLNEIFKAIDNEKVHKQNNTG